MSRSMRAMSKQSPASMCLGIRCVIRRAPGVYHERHQMCELKGPRVLAGEHSPSLDNFKGRGVLVALKVACLLSTLFSRFNGGLKLRQLMPALAQGLKQSNGQGKVSESAAVRSGPSAEIQLLTDAAVMS
eukprot:1161203-Pelagomonas_calceolata.AAC.2